MYVWEATSEKLIALTLAGDVEIGAFSAAYQLGGRYIIATSEDGIITKWDTLTNCLVYGEIIVEEQMDLGWMVSVVFSLDRKSVVLSDNQRSIWVWDADTGK